MNSLRMAVLPLAHARALTTASPSALAALRSSPMTTSVDLSAVAPSPQQQQRQADALAQTHDRSGETPQQRTHYVYGASMTDVISYFQSDSDLTL